MIFTAAVLRQLLQSRLFYLHLRAIPVLGWVIYAADSRLEDEAFDDQLIHRAVDRVQVGRLAPIQLLHTLAGIAGLSRRRCRCKGEL